MRIRGLRGVVIRDDDDCVCPAPTPSPTLGETLLTAFGTAALTALAAKFVEHVWPSKAEESSDDSEGMTVDDLKREIREEIMAEIAAQKTRRK